MTTNIFEEFDEQSQTLLQGLKPIDLDRLKSDFFNKNNFDQNSGFVNSPFGQYWDINIHEWAKPYFGNAKILDKANIKIADKSLKVSHNQADSYNLLVKDNTSKYTFVVYADPDGEKVLEMYNNPENIPDPKKPFEVLVFIETDDGKFDFGKIVRVKFGASVIDDLIYKFSEELPWNDNDPEDIAKKFITSAWETSNNHSFNQAKNEAKNDDGAFNDLLIKAIKYEYDNKKFDDFSWFITILKGAEYLGLNMPNWCFSLGGWFRERKYTEDKYWNGDLPEKEYTPAFMPNFLFYDEKEDRSRALKDSFNDTYNYLIEKVGESLPNEDYLSQRIKSLLLYKISECKIITDKFIDDFLSVVNIPDGYFQTFIKHYHAYTLGLYNGIMELLASICDLTALVILICRDELGFRMTDLLLEKFENFTNELFDNTIETLKKIGYKTIEIFIDFAKWYNDFLEYDGKSYKILKEIGELVPDILTFVIPVLKGSKVAKVGKVGSEAVEVVEKNVVKELSEAEAKQMTKAAKEAIEKGTAREAAREGAELIEEKIIEKTTTQLDEVVVESKRVLDDVNFEKRSVYWKKISDEITSKVLKNEVFQSTNNLNLLYKQAEKANKQLIKKTNIFAKETKGKAGFRDGLKSKERAIEKINSDYDGDASQLLDIAGSKVVYKSLDELYSALKTFHKENKILKFKDRIQEPLNGYRDILMNIKMNNGHIVEFRLHLKEMDKVADGVGHKLYEEIRSIEAKANIAKRDLTFEELNRKLELELKIKELYDNAWKKIINK